jgi:hypothetical protein
MGKSMLSFNVLSHKPLQAVFDSRTALSKFDRDGELAAAKVIRVFYLPDILGYALALRQVFVY